jgi:hypothetical protein
VTEVQTGLHRGQRSVWNKEVDVRKMTCGRANFFKRSKEILHD